MKAYSLLNPCLHYQTHPQYAWAKQARDTQIAIHWDVNQVDHTRTKKTFYSLPQSYQDSIIRILQFFTQADTCVCSNYLDHLLVIFKTQEVNAMLCEFANMENVHVTAYAKLFETLSFPRERVNSFFTEYQTIKQMQDKADFADQYSLKGVTLKILEHRMTGDYNIGEVLSKKDLQDILLNLACFAAFTEGTQLYSSFALLFEPCRAENGGNIPGLSKTVEWSVRDENLHTLSCLKLFHATKAEHPEIWTEEFKKEIYTICGAIVHFEDAFIDYVMKPCNGQFMTISAEQLKHYIRYIADTRLEQLGLKPMFIIPSNPLPFMDDILAINKANFFESVVTDYSHNTTTGSWKDCIYY